jgi:invasion protein IalB
MGKLFIAAIGSLLVSSVAVSPAVAQSQTAQQQATVKNAHDPNEVVCERQEETGSRLAAQRVCHTRAEWAEQRRLDRQDVDHAQVSRGNADNGGN